MVEKKVSPRNGAITAPPTKALESLENSYRWGGPLQYRGRRDGPPPQTAADQRRPFEVIR